MKMPMRRPINPRLMLTPIPTLAPVRRSSSLLGDYVSTAVEEGKMVLAEATVELEVEVVLPEERSEGVT